MSKYMYLSLKEQESLYLDSCLAGYRNLRKDTHLPYRNLPFSKKYVKHFSHLGKLFDHRRCINSVKWALDGSILITAGDDREIKLWNAERIPDFNLSSTIKTTHSGNIFCAEMSPCNPNVVLSCGADGYMNYHELTNSQASLRLMESDDIM
jgi:WD40 repeat protein